MAVKHCCKNCHFLQWEVGAGGDTRVFSWPRDERDKIRSSIDRDYTASCHMGVWNTRIDPSLKSRLEEITSKDRKDTCFFMKIEDGMSFPAAKELERRASDRRAFLTTVRVAAAGLLIAAIGHVISLLVKS